MTATTRTRPAAPHQHSPVAASQKGTVRLPRLALSSGRVVEGVEVAYEVVGAAGVPLVVVLGGISASRHVTAHASDPSPGWWDTVVGEDGPLDTRRWRALGIDYLGGVGASSNLSAPDLRGGGAPAVSTHDQARAVVAVLDALEVGQARAVIGASYGGMVALALAAVAPARLARGVVISAADRSHPMSTALRSLQRQVVRLGVTSGHAREAVALARGIAMTTYRTAPEFAARFGADGTEPSASLAAVDGYLAYQGEHFARRFDPGAFLRLSESLDLHHVPPATIRAPLTLVAVDSDTLVPPSQIRALHERLRRLGRPSSLVEIRSRYGHDAFLKERAAMASILNAALTARGHR